MDWSKYYPANYSAITEADIEMIREKRKLDPVDKDAVKQDWKDRSDDEFVDIDNDGDEDDSDKFLHKKRKAISKAVEDNTNDVSDDGDEMDKVQPKALKKKFDKRKDTDIDNDGDTDDSDEVIHAKRKAISKAIAKQDETEEDYQDDVKAAWYQGDDAYAAHKAANPRMHKKEPDKKKVNIPAPKDKQERDKDKWYAKRESWYPVDEKEEVEEAKGEGCPCCDGGPCECPEGCKDCDCSANVDEMSKDEYKDVNMKKQQKKKKKKDDPEEVEYSLKQDTVTNMDDQIYGTKESVSHGKPGAVDIYKETIALAKVTRGRDKLSLEGAAKLIKQRSYEKLAPYLDSMEEEPRQSVLMILMNDQKIADKVMKKMKTEKYHGWLMSEMHQKYDGLTWAEIGERLIRTPERRLVSLAYATKMGTIDAPSPEVQKLADECELADLEKAAGSIIGEDDDLDENLNELENPIKKFQQDRTQKKAEKAQARMDRDDKHADNLAVIQKEKDRAAAAKAAKGPSLVQKAAGAIKTAVTGGGKGKSDAEKIADKNKSDNAKKAASTNSNNQSDQKKADTSRAADSAAADKDQAKRQADAEKDRALRKKQDDAAKARRTDDGGVSGIKKDAGPSTTRSKLANLAFSAMEAYEEDVPETIDARRRVFKEKIRKLAYEKAREIIAKQQSEPDPALESKKEEEDSEELGSKIKETGKVDNKIKMEPTVKESTGVSFVRKYKQKMAAEQKDATLENNILEYLAGSSFGGVGQANPVGGEFASDDSPASATSIARALKCSPMQVQKLLDDMLEAGQISRVGDAYSYASPRPAEPQGEKENSGLEV